MRHAFQREAADLEPFETMAKRWRRWSRAPAVDKEIGDGALKGKRGDASMEISEERKTLVRGAAAHDVAKREKKSVLESRNNARRPPEWGPVSCELNTHVLIASAAPSEQCCYRCPDARRSSREAGHWPNDVRSMPPRDASRTAISETSRQRQAATC